MMTKRFLWYHVVPLAMQVFMSDVGVNGATTNASLLYARGSSGCVCKQITYYVVPSASLAQQSWLVRRMAWSG
jgi:antibiotic biosynthesis monooxygenase (ABM) superfamily enzyme